MFVEPFFLHLNSSLLFSLRALEMDNDVLAADTRDVAMLVEALRLGFSPAALAKVKDAAPPLNVLVEVGSDRDPKAVGKHNLKEYKEGRLCFWPPDP
jgi:hypothetical protein